jgi:hypothetical protein
MQYDIEPSKLLTDEQHIEIGFMTAGGKLIVFVNKNLMIYTRIQHSPSVPDDLGIIKECKIGAGKIRIYGSNVQASINVCPMTFAPLSVMAFEIPVMETTGPDGIETTAGLIYHGINNKGEYDGTVARIPQEPEVPGVLYGVDCEFFHDATSRYDAPYGFGFHEQGEVRFIEGKLTGSLATVAPGLYVLIMQPSNEDLIMQSTVTNADGTSSIVSTPYSIPNWGCPYFFRMKGVYQDLTPPPPPVFRETIPEVISIHETMQASDFFHVERTANIVVYNKGGHYDYLREAQYGIRISWGWNCDPDNPPTRTFTGIVIGVNSGEVAGKEIIEIQCQDYMYILRNMPIINSPFYDGMIDHYAIADMAERAGIVTTIPNWYGQIDQYFLNAGYAITQPAVRYTGTQMLYDCMIDVVKRSESYIYFDEDGNFHVTRLPGGLFGEGSHNLVMADFTRDPNGTSVILDEKNVEYSTDSSFNEISVLTMDRNTRNPIIVAKQASGINILQFKKTHLIDQPAFGSKSAAWVQLLRMAEREFYPIRKISFKTAGNIDSLLRVFDFIIVDGDEFRLLSINRNYNAESNDFTADYNAEWLYGLGNGP